MDNKLLLKNVALIKTKKIKYYSYAKRWCEIQGYGTDTNITCMAQENLFLIKILGPEKILSSSRNNNYTKIHVLSLVNTKAKQIEA